MTFYQEIEDNKETKREEERTWIFNDTGEISEENLEKLITTYGGEMISTKNVEIGGIAVTTKETNAVAIMCEIKDFCAREQFRIQIPKDLLQGSANIFIRYLNSTLTATDIVNMIEEAGVEVLNLYIIRNKVTKNFTELVKAVLLGNNTLDKWMTDRKANLGDVRITMERERKQKNSTIATVYSR